jgi:hypothetical protein
MSCINYFMLTWRQEIVCLVDRASKYIFVKENQLDAQFIVSTFHQTSPDDGRWIRPKPIEVLMKYTHVKLCIKLVFLYTESQEITKRKRSMEVLHKLFENVREFQYTGNTVPNKN